MFYTIGFHCCYQFILPFLSLHAGQFCGFDTEEPTSESGGKPRVVALLKEKHSYQNLVMVGDGATDMEASPPAVSVDSFRYTCYKLVSNWILTSCQPHRVTSRPSAVSVDSFCYTCYKLVSN